MVARPRSTRECCRGFVYGLREGGQVPVVDQPSGEVVGKLGKRVGPGGTLRQDLHLDLFDDGDGNFYNGSAPIPASSGRTSRHRLNRSGNRTLNRALYTIAITQIRADTEGRAYYLRKRAEGKTAREALRCLKRRLSDVIYRTLREDLAAAESSQALPQAA